MKRVADWRVDNPDRRDITLGGRGSIGKTGHTFFVVRNEPVPTAIELTQTEAEVMEETMCSAY